MNSAKEQYIKSKEQLVRTHYKKFAPEYPKWLRKRKYYYDRKIKILRHLIPHPGRVLEIGCAMGQNLAGIDCEYGLGIDVCPEIIEEARKLHPPAKFPHLEFKHMSALECGSLNMKFDTILLVNSISEIPDLIRLFEEIRKLCTIETRIVHVSFNYILEPLIKGAGLLGLSPKHPLQNWFTRFDHHNLVNLTELELIREGYDLIVPVNVPVVSDFLNRFIPLVPFLQPLCMLYYTVLRPISPVKDREDNSVTVCVPCKNEEGNIAELVQRIPEMGKGTEIIFVDDASDDSTAEQIRGQIKAHPERRIKMVKGPGEGKGGACRAGFAVAENDILMILDADMTVMPEDLPEFLQAIVSGKGEFINGSRLVYPPEDHAMRFANMIGNKIFAMLFSFLLSQKIKDTLCGTKVMWRRDYWKILETREHFGMVDRWGDYDWIFGAARYNLKLLELPIHYRERVTGETKMTKRLQNARIMLKMCNLAFWNLKVI